MIIAVGETSKHGAITIACKMNSLLNNSFYVNNHSNND